MGHKLYMYYASPWYSSRYNTNNGKSTLLPQNVFSGYLTQFALAQYDRVPYNSSLAGTMDDTQNSIKPWEYVVLADGSGAADLNEGTVAFNNPEHFAYDNRITMFAQRSDGSVKPAGEITGGFVERNRTVGIAYSNTAWLFGTNLTGGTLALVCVPVVALIAVIFALIYRKKKKTAAAAAVHNEGE